MNDTVALITGGAGNLGRAVTRTFLENGARVAVPFYKTDQPDALDALRGEFGDRLFPIALDLTTERGAYAAVEQVLEWGGRLDTVAHLVGGWRGGMPLAETPIEVWDRMMDLNLKSAWLVARAAVPAMVRGGGGSLVFVSSRAARAGRTGHGAYAVAKAAVITLAEVLAEEHRADGIRVNAVLPGTVDTEDNRRAMPDADHSAWTAPEEIARVIHFLASDAAAAVSGAAVPVYGQS
ncbi:MAG TPA: SDR family oxidoreductase [Longimicrobiaceae bacterium]|nr:SDR family oxidoreductase [Longimicrobiaceae bacterium]